MLNIFRRYFFRAAVLFTAVSVFLTPDAAAAPKKRKSADKWRIQKSANYDLHTNMPGRGTTTRILNRLEKARENFRFYLPPADGQPLARGKVRLFRDRESYLQTVGENFKWSAGLWNGKELLISPPPGESSRRVMRNFVSEVLFHEGFHQYLASLLPGKHVGMWFNEGCAKLFQDLDSQGVIRLDKDDEKKLELTVRRNRRSVRQLIMLDYRQFYDQQTREENYLLAHALMYFLYQGAPANDNKMAQLPAAYLDLIRRNTPPPRAEQFLDKQFNFDRLDREFRDFWSSPAQLNRARRHNGGKRK